MLQDSPKGRFYIIFYHFGDDFEAIFDDFPCPSYSNFEVDFALYVYIFFKIICDATDSIPSFSPQVFGTVAAFRA